MSPEYPFTPSRSIAIIWFLVYWLGPILWLGLAVVAANYYGNEIEIITLPFINIDRITQRRLLFVIVAGSCLFIILFGYSSWKNLLDELDYRDMLYLAANAALFVIALLCAYCRVPLLAQNTG